MNDDIDVGTMAGEMLVDGVIENLVNTMMEAAFIGVADVHPRPLAHRLESLEFVDLGGVIRLSHFAYRLIFRHRIRTNQ